MAEERPAPIYESLDRRSHEAEGLLDGTGPEVEYVDEKSRTRRPVDAPLRQSRPRFALHARGLFFLVLATALITATIAVHFGGVYKARRYWNTYGKDPTSFEAGVEKLRGKKVVFVGDSLMRYKYIDLVYYLANGVTPSQVTNDTTEGSRNPVIETTFGGWPEFYDTDMMQGYEVCDCYRGVTGPDFDLKTQGIENRYFAKGDFDISYYQFFYDMQPPACTFRGRTRRLAETGVNINSPFDWCLSIDGFMESLAAQKPDIVLMNTGVWQQIDHRAADAIADYVARFPRFIWMTTTPSKEFDLPAGFNGEVLRKLQHHAKVTIINAHTYINKLKETVGPSIYWDNTHFVGWVYDEMLRQAFLTL